MNIIFLRSKEYYGQLKNIIMADHKKIQYHIVQAENYKRIYDATKRRRGIYVIFNKFARRRNGYHVDVGYTLCLNDLELLTTEMKYLENRIAT